MLKSLYAQNYGFIFKNKNCGYLEISLLHRSIEKLISKKTTWWSSCPKAKPKYAQNWDQKDYVMGYVIGHN